MLIDLLIAHDPQKTISNNGNALKAYKSVLVCSYHSHNSFCRL